MAKVSDEASSVHPSDRFKTRSNGEGGGKASVRHPSGRLKTGANGRGDGLSVRSVTSATVSRQDPMAKEADEASVRARQRPIKTGYNGEGG